MQQNTEATTTRNTYHITKQHRAYTTETSRTHVNINKQQHKQNKIQKQTKTHKTKTRKNATHNKNI